MGVGEGVCVGGGVGAGVGVGVAVGIGVEVEAGRGVGVGVRLSDAVAVGMVVACEVLSSPAHDDMNSARAAATSSPQSAAFLRTCLVRSAI